MAHQYHVESKTPGGKWLLQVGSTDNKSYALGWMHGMLGFYPCPPVRVVRDDGEVIEEHQGNGAVEVEQHEETYFEKLSHELTEGWQYVQLVDDQGGLSSIRHVMNIPPGQLFVFQEDPERVCRMLEPTSTRHIRWKRLPKGWEPT